MKSGTHTANERAAAWLVRRDAGLTPAEERELAQWLEESSDHRQAWEEAQAVWQGVTRPDATFKETVLEELERWEAQKRERRRRLVPFLTLSTLAAAAALVLVFRTPDPVSTGMQAPAFVQRPQQQRLEDGSRVQLNAATEIEVDFTPTKRRVHLLRGEAHFDVAKDAARPFVVAVGALSVEAVGTEFLVRIEPDNLDVLVTEGKVKVVASGRGEAAVAVLPLAAGEFAGIPLSDEPVLPAAGRAVSPGQIDEALAWRTMRVEFSGTPLADVIGLFNEKSRIKLKLSDPTLGRMRVSGTYWVNNAEGFARLLENGFSIRAERTGENEILLRPSAEGG